MAFIKVLVIVWATQDDIKYDDWREAMEEDQCNTAVEMYSESDKVASIYCVDADTIVF